MIGFHGRMNVCVGSHYNYALWNSSWEQRRDRRDAVVCVATQYRDYIICLDSDSQCLIRFIRLRPRHPTLLPANEPWEEGEVCVCVYVCVRAHARARVSPCLPHAAASPVMALYCDWSSWIRARKSMELFREMYSAVTEQSHSLFLYTFGRNHFLPNRSSFNYR